MGLTTTSYAATASSVTCYTGNNYSSNWSTTTTTNKQFCASWTEWSGEFLSNSNQKRSRITVTTDTAGATSISLSIAITGRHAWTSSQTVGKIYWTVTSSSSSNPSSGTALSLNGTAVGSTATGTITMNLMPSTTYYVWIWCTATTDTYGGTATITASGSYGQPGNITTSASSVDFGTAVTISYPASPTTGATYTVTVQVSGQTAETLQTTASTSSRSWTPSTSYISSFTTVKSTTATITVKTYYGSTLAGTKTKTITLTIPSSYGPTLASGAFAVSASNTGGVSGMTGYIQNNSKALVTYTSSKVTLNGGATVSKWSVKLNTNTAVDVAASTSTYTTATLTTDSTIVCTLTDSRGYTASQSFDITIIPYAAPSLGSIAAAFRSTSAGVASDSGTYISVPVTATYASIDGQNAITVQLGYKLATASSWTNVTVTGGTTTTSGTNKILTKTHINSGFADNSYDIRLVVTDTVGNSSTVTGSIASASWAIHFHRSGSTIVGVGLGKKSEITNAVEIPASWDYYTGTYPVLSTKAQTLTAAQISQVFTNLGLGNVATLNYEEVT